MALIFLVTHFTIKLISRDSDKLGLTISFIFTFTSNYLNFIRHLEFQFPKIYATEIFINNEILAY